MRMATGLFTLLCAAAWCSAHSTAARAGDGELPDRQAKACFDRIKSLAGDWVAKDPNSDKEHVAHRFRVTSGGTAVEEIELPGTPYEMISMFHRDGAALVMTHYCAMGNQPRMKATAANTPDRIVFEYTGGTGFKSVNDMHMHALTLSTDGKARIREDWTTFQGGKKLSTDSYESHRKAG